MERSTLGQQLTAQAALRGMSQREAGEELGISQATFSRWASGESVPASTHWTAIARFLKIPRNRVAEAVLQMVETNSTQGQSEQIARLETQVVEMREQLDYVVEMVTRLAEGRRRR